MSERPKHGLAWFTRYPRDALRSDLSAGITTAVVMVPQAMAYAMLAGLPPIVGLYAALAASSVYPLLGTSRQLSVGPVAMDSLITASAVGAVATSGSGAYGDAAVSLALMVGAVQVCLSALRGGFVVNFLSRPVVSGFTSAAAIVIASSQLGELLQLELPRTQHVHEVWAAALGAVGEWHGLTLFFGLVALALLKWLPKLTGKVPASLVVMGAAIGASHLLELDAHGMRLLGPVPSGLPSLNLPSLNTSLMAKLWPSALTIALVSYMETITTGAAFARKHGYELAPGRELLAVGAANLASSVVNGYPVAGGLSRSAVNERAGAQTPVANLVTAVAIALSLSLLTPLFTSLPRAALSAVVLSAVLTLVDLRTPRELLRVKRSDLALLLLTFVATLTLGISQGVLAGVAASLAWFVVRTTRPHYAMLGQIPGTQAYLNLTRHADAVQVPGVLIVRMDAQLYFGNVSFLRETLRELEERAETRIHALVLDAGGVNDLDSSGLDAIVALDRDYKQRGLRLLFARVKGPVRDVMQKAGLLHTLREEQRIFTRTHDAAECARSYAKSPTAPCLAACGDLSEAEKDGTETRLPPSS